MGRELGGRLESKKKWISPQATVCAPILDMSRFNT
jgi:hypothetical protein